MKLTSMAVLFGVAVVSTVFAKPDDNQEVTTLTPSSSSSPATAKLTTTLPESTPATPSTTTTPKPTSSTAQPTSSSTQTPTTTTNPTTPSPTTPSPQPTSTIAPTSPKPSPKPAPKEYYWNLTDADGKVCILAKADITLKLIYTNGTSGKQITDNIKILPNATSSGMCGEKNQILQLTLGNTSIAFDFKNESGEYHLSKISSNITLHEVLGNQTYISLASDDLKVFKTKLNTSYECRWSEPAVLKENDEYVNITKATLHVNMDNIRFEAFRQLPGDNFAKAYACEMDNTDLVPIMVGIALGILVAVVLIAYLVGRRSTQAQGYLSM